MVRAVSMERTTGYRVLEADDGNGEGRYLVSNGETQHDSRRRIKWLGGITPSRTVLATALLVGGMAAAPSPAAAQEHEAAGSESEHHEARPRHRLALFTGNTWVPQSSHSGAINGLIAAPTIGIDYAFRFGEGFAIASINDVQVDQYVIERDDGSELERERLFVTSLVLMWEAAPRLGLLAGPGIETDKHGTFGLVKLGLEWELFAPHPWDVALSLAWDIKEEYDAIAVGLSIGRLWQ